MQENTERLAAALKFYGELLNVKLASSTDLENIKLKQEYVKKEILKLTLKNKKLLREMELRFEGGRRG